MFSYAVPTHSNPNLSSFGYCQSYVVLREPDGKFLLCGYISNPWQSGGFTLMRLAEQGTLNTGEIESGVQGAFPNPFQDEIHLAADGPLKSAAVFDLTGRKIADAVPQYDNGQATINLSAISQTGTYIIKWVTDQGEVKVDRIIKK